MLNICPKCKAQRTESLTEEVESNDDFIKYFREFIFCPKCENYIFLGKEKELIPE